MQDHVEIKELPDDTDFSSEEDNPVTIDIIKDIAKTPMNGVIEFVCAKDMGEMIVNRVRTRLSRVRAQARKQGRQIQEFKLYIDKVEQQDGRDKVYLKKTNGYHKRAVGKSDVALDLLTLPDEE